MAVEFGFEPGQKVIWSPPAPAFGDGRTPVREAMNRLANRGGLTRGHALSVTGGRGFPAMHPGSLVVGGNLRGGSSC